MDSDPNTTHYITLDGYVAIEQYRALYFIVMFTAYIIVICSNSTIVCLIWIHKNLHEPMYFFIAALLCNSILYSTAIYPKMMFEILSEKQEVTYSVCLLQYFCFYALIGSEFLLLTAMAYDRYLAICKPLHYSATMKKATVSFLIVFAWVMPACQVSVPTILNRNKQLCNVIFQGIICNSTIYRLHCANAGFLNIYGLLVLINLCFFPVIFECFTYARIFIITNSRGAEVRKKAVQTCLPHLLVLINLTCSATYDVLLVRIQTVFPKTVRLIMTFQVVLYHPLFHPFIYGLKMKEISKHLKSLLRIKKTEPN
ncbi:olfactory receptor 6N2-like [Boleophthalmus pectinirostris]|uniref:olfactory receptor 6N2-like n=1 Tax=Boleophthalmus pectinirostris TaxID=150288 RepID=UPI002430B201|nr:olfactory receptor 6N2-like [Boleophthalmus pectinirostris]